jgi:hypothetical protein
MRPIQALIAAALALAVSAAALPAQDGAIGASQRSAPGETPSSVAGPEGTLPPELLKVAMRLSLSYRIVSRTNADDVWEAKADKLILPNRTVQLRMVGEDIIIVVQLTPLVGEEDSAGFTLRALGQVWLRLPGQGLSYTTSLSTLPLKYGEKAYFYPLGSKNAGKDMVEVVLRIDEPGSGN